jgi:hypothetical protein
MKGLVCLGVLVSAIYSWAVYPNGASTEGNVDATKLLQWVTSHKTSANLTNANAFANQDGDPLTVSLYQLGGRINGTQPIFWTSNMDVDCDGTKNAICSGPDPDHQWTLSCGCSVNEGGDVDAAQVPFYVIPGCSDCGDCGGTWGPFAYNQRGIQYGQVAAIIYNTGGKTGVCYAVFLDEDGCNTEIGEGSPAACSFLGVNPDPDNGGSDDNNVAWIVFPGPGNRISDYANHGHAVTVGQAAAKALLATGTLEPGSAKSIPVFNDFKITMRNISITSAGNHSVSVYTMNGQSIITKNGIGAQSYNLSSLKAGSYIVKVRTAEGEFTQKVAVY